jgi:transposase
MALRGGYAGAAHPPAVKEALGAVGAQLRAREWSVTEIGRLFDEAGYKVGERTLLRWTDAADAGQPITSANKRSGSQKVLDYEQRKIAAGWVLSEDEKVDRRRFSNYITDEFGVDISPPTASRYLAEFELSRQMMGTRPRPIGVSFEEYAQEGYDYIVDLHNSAFFLHDPSLIWSVDFTSTAIRQQRLHTYGAKGGKQKKSTKGNHVYTDNIFTAIALDGSMIPPHAFSHNPALMPGAGDLGVLCQQYDVSPDHVHYCPEAANWVGESASMVYSVVKLYSWEDCYVVHDDGNSLEASRCLHFHRV